MEELLNGEQPIMATTSPTNVENDLESKDQLSGSPLGKFKSVDSLLKAYNELQAEFTKKCQAYNELKGDNANAPSVKETDWQTHLDDFLKFHPDAKNYSKDISEVIANDEKLLNNPFALEIAYGQILEKENVKLSGMLKDDNYLVGALSPSMKEKLVSDYISRVTKTTPSLISKGGTNVVCNNAKPTSIFEAGEMAKKIFK